MPSKPKEAIIWLTLKVPITTAADDIHKSKKIKMSSAAIFWGALRVNGISYDATYMYLNKLY